MLSLRLRASFRREAVSTHNSGADDRIFLEIFRSLNRQQLGKFRSGSIDLALHCTRGTSAHLRRLVIGKPGRSNQYESSALLRRQLIPSPTDQNPWAHWRNAMDMMRQG